MRIGIDLGGTKTEVIALSDQGEQLFRHRLPTRGRTTGKPSRPCHSGGDGRAGDRTAGYRGDGHSWLNFALYRGGENANSTWLNGQPFDKDLSLRLEREVRLANDANCLAVSEAVDGRGGGAQTVFAVIIGTGCGAGGGAQRAGAYRRQW